MKNFFFALLLMGGTLHAGVRPDRLRCEYLANPQGIDVTEPRLSWVMISTDAQARSLRQSAYRILVASDERKLAAGDGDLWDTGKVSSAQSTQIVYAGTPLRSGAPVFWKVRIWDQDEKASDWSAPARWSMGLLSSSDWHGKWIGRDDPPKANESKEENIAHRLPARQLRKEFALDSGKQVRRAMVYYSGLGLSELYVNGSRVGDHVLSPGLTDYDKRALYVTFDVTGQLQPGRNALGLMLGNGRYWAPRGPGGRSARDFGYPKAILELVIEYADGSTARVVSDESWKVTSEGPIRANNEYDGEEYDARLEIPGWARAGFDDSQWQPVQVVTGPGGVLSAQMAEPLRVIENVTPVAVRPLKPAVYIYDMGQNMVGWVRLKVKGPTDTQVRLRFAETLQPDGSLYVANMRTAKATDLYTLKGEGEEVWEPRFVYHGFRYVELTGYPGDPTPATIEGRVVHDAMEKAGEFVSSDDMLNKIHHNIYWGIRGNYRSIPTDCPQRDERQGWLGDRSQVSRGEASMFDVAAFYSKWSTDLMDAQRPTGSIPDVAPNFWIVYPDDVTWPSTMVFIPGMLYDHYGDRRVVERAYPAMKQWVEYMRGFLKDSLLDKDRYGDWCVPPESPELVHSKDPARMTDHTLLASSYYYYLLRQMAFYARVSGRQDDAAGYEEAASQVKDAFQRRFFRADSGQYDNGTQTSSVLPLAFGMAAEKDRAAVMQSLVGKIERESNFHVGTGLVGAQWLMRALTENGQGDLAFRIATEKTYPGWGYMVERGATTVWELWNGDTANPSMNSGNHVMQIGDLGIWMYEYLAGIRPDREQPGFRHIVIRPYPVSQLNFVKATRKTIMGEVSSAWKRDQRQFSLEVTIPPNTTATIRVPAKDPAKVMESGKPATQARGLKFVRNENGAAVFEAESGSYRFVAAE